MFWMSSTQCMDTHDGSLWDVAHRVPDLQLDLFAVNVDHACAKLDANGKIVDRLKPLVRELQQQA
jgi:hypothetical protein